MLRLFSKTVKKWMVTNESFFNTSMLPKLFFYEIFYKYFKKITICAGNKEKFMKRSRHRPALWKKKANSRASTTQKTQTMHKIFLNCRKKRNCMVKETRLFIIKPKTKNLRITLVQELRREHTMISNIFSSPVTKHLFLVWQLKMMTLRHLYVFIKSSGRVAGVFARRCSTNISAFHDSFNNFWELASSALFIRKNNCAIAFYTIWQQNLRQESRNFTKNEDCVV